MERKGLLLAALGTLAFATACQTDQAGKTVNSAGNSMASAARGAVSLVNVDLSNVLNKVAVNLNVDKANIPVNAQIPVTLAANICGVSINVLSASHGGNPSCTAKSTSPALEQAVQQQMAANGSVGGGSQSNGGTSSTPSPSPTPSTSPTPTGTTPGAPSPMPTATATPLARPTTGA